MIFGRDKETYTYEWASLAVPTVEQLNQYYNNFKDSLNSSGISGFSFEITDIHPAKVNCEVGCTVGKDVYFRCHCVNASSDPIDALMSHFNHTFKQIDGSMKWPNSHEGDMLRGAYNILK
jgi:hypothetical protein